MKKLLLLLPFVLVFMACQKELSLETAGSTSAPGSSSGTASYRLSGAGSTCTGFALSGIYQAGMAMVSGDSVVLQVTVDTIGTYNLSTNTTNGIVFTGGGTFTKTGVQTIALTATGTPIAAGAFVYTPPVGAGCNFTVTVVSGSTTTSGDYLPTTTNTYWTLVDVASPGDSTRNTMLATNTVLSGNTYRNILTDDGTFKDTGYIRKAVPLYYAYVNVGQTFNIAASTNSEEIILKDNVAVGSSWNYSYSGTINSLPVTATSTYTISEKGVAATLNGLNFSNVIKVKNVKTIGIAGVPSILSLKSENWYALNVGPIYESETDSSSSGIMTTVYAIKSYKVF